MKRLATLLIAAAFTVVACKKENDVDPIEQEEVGQENEQEEDGVFTFQGEKFDNQRVSIPETKDINIVNTLYVSRLDSTFVPDSTYNLTWTILVPEEESVKAEWSFELDAPFIKTEKKYWHSEERIWRYVFNVNLSDPNITGSGKLTLSMLNEKTAEVITRDYNVKVDLAVEKTDVNCVNFGMNKSEVKERELGWNLTNPRQIFHSWGEYLPNVSYMAFTGKWLMGGICTYEFENNKLVRVTEFDNYTHLGWYNSPETLFNLFRKLHLQKLPELQIDPITRSTQLEEPISWEYNGLRITVDPAREYHIDGEPKKKFAVIFEPAN